MNRLVYIEEFRYIDQAITREKEIKKMARRRKIELIESSNPDWQDINDF